MDEKIEKLVKEAAVAITTGNSVLLQKVNASLEAMTEEELLDIVRQILQRELGFWEEYLRSGEVDYPEDCKRQWDTAAALQILVEDIYPQFEEEYSERFEKKQFEYPPRIELEAAEADYVEAHQMGIETNPPFQTRIVLVIEVLAVSARCRGALKRGIRGVFKEKKSLEGLVVYLKAAITFF